MSGGGSRSQPVPSSRRHGPGRRNLRGGRLDMRGIGGMRGPALVTVALAIFLAGCGGGTSKAEIASAIQRALSATSVQKIECKSAGSNGSGEALQSCEVEYKARNNGGAEGEQECTETETVQVGPGTKVAVNSGGTKTLAAGACTDIGHPSHPCPTDEHVEETSTICAEKGKEKKAETREHAEEAQKQAREERENAHREKAGNSIDSPEEEEHANKEEAREEAQKQKAEAREKAEGG
jgi:hypothetical protein